MAKRTAITAPPTTRAARISNLTERLTLVTEALLKGECSQEKSMALGRQQEELIVELLTASSLPLATLRVLQASAKDFPPSRMPYNKIGSSFRNSSGEYLSSSSAGTDISCEYDQFLTEFRYPYFDKLQDFFRMTARNGTPSRERGLEFYFSTLLSYIKDNIFSEFFSVINKAALQESSESCAGRVELAVSSLGGAVRCLALEVNLPPAAEDNNAVLAQCLTEAAMLQAVNSAELATLDYFYQIVADAESFRVYRVSSEREVVIVCDLKGRLWPASEGLADFGDGNFDCLRPLVDALGGLLMLSANETCKMLASRSNSRARNYELDKCGKNSSSTSFRDLPDDRETSPILTYRHWKEYQRLSTKKRKLKRELKRWRMQQEVSRTDRIPSEELDTSESESSSPPAEPSSPPIQSTSSSDSILSKRRKGRKTQEAFRAYVEEFAKFKVDVEEKEAGNDDQVKERLLKLFFILPKTSRRRPEVLVEAKPLKRKGRRGGEKGIGLNKRQKMS